MKILSIGTDRKLFEDSPVRRRAVAYGAHAEFHSIVFTKKSHGFSDTTLSPTVFLYPTNSSSRWMYVWDAIRLAKKIVVEKKFIRGDAVVTAQDPFESGWTAFRIARYFRLPLHLQVHTDLFSPFFATTFLDRVRVRCARYLLPRADKVRVVSPHIARSIQKAGISLKQSPQILPVRIELKDRQQNLPELFPEFTFKVLMASRLTKEKRITDGMQAFARLHAQYPFAGLIIAGEGKELPRLKQKAKNLGIEKSTVFLGWQKDLASLMQSSNVFLSTSEYEGYGMSIVEAGSLGVPVVTTAVGVAGEDGLFVDGRNALVCPVGDIDCISRALLKLLNDLAFREVISGKLSVDIRTSIPELSHYAEEYVAGIIQAIHDVS